MANISEITGKRGTTYRVNYASATKPQNSRTFKSERLANQYKNWRELEPGADDTAFDLKYGAGVAPVAPSSAKPKAPTLGEFWPHVQAGDGHGANRSQASDSVVRNMLAHFHDRPLDAVTTLEVKKWVVRMLKLPRENGKPYAPRSVDDAIAELRRIYRAAVYAGHVKADANPTLSRPGQRVGVPKGYRVRRKISDADVYTVAELDAILKCVPRRWLAFYTVAADTGARTEEIVGLAARHFNFASEYPLTLGLQVAEEQRSPEFKIVLRDFAKTESSDDRETWLRSATIDAVRDYMAEYPADGETLFRTESGAIPNQANLRRIWRGACEAAGVRYLPPRNLRHTAASHMLAATLDVVEVAHRLGHKDPSVTLGTYARFMPRARTTAPAKMEEWRDGQK
jgi:integrase